MASLAFASTPSGIAFNINGIQKTTPYAAVRFELQLQTCSYPIASHRRRNWDSGSSLHTKEKVTVKNS